MDETTAVPPAAAPTAGWYPDPQNSAQQRWWTGQGWSEHVQTPAPVTPPHSGTPPAGYSSPAFMTSAAAPTYEPPADPSSAPLYGASFSEAFARFWKKYATFSGRASRSEYWWLQLDFIGVYILTVILGAAAGNGSTNSPGYATVGTLYVIWALAIAIPALALLVRRLHDGNLSGWYVLLGLIPFAGALILLIFTVRDSNPEGQRFDRR
ncbi:MAG: hypothetical protein QOH55_953 [Microbacteriaceae bacterium]|nr:hypothetical protein [Microbacteriaceae bacterium]